MLPGHGRNLRVGNRTGKNMVSISIGNLWDNQESAWLNLNGGSIEPPLLGTVYDYKIQPGSTVTENLHIALRGSTSSIRNTIKALEDYLVKINRHSREGIGQPHYLRMYDQNDSSYRYSHLLSAHLEGLPDTLLYKETGSLAIDLIVTRENFWDSDEIALPLSNSTGTDVTSGLTIFNHAAETYENYCTIDTSGLGSDFPPPMRLEFTNLYSSNLLGDLWMGAFGLDSEGEFPNLQFEIATGTAGSLVMDSSASNGSYFSATWTAAGWQTLTTLLISSSTLQDCDGRWFLPILRLHTDPSIANLQLRLAITAGASTIFESPAKTISTTQCFALFTPIQLPMGDLPKLSASTPYTVNLQALCPSSGSYALQLDWLGFLPQDLFTYYQSIAGAAQSDVITDDGFSGKVATNRSYAELITHRRVGSPPLLVGKHSTRLYLFMVSLANKAETARAISLKAWYRKRRQVL